MDMLLSFDIIQQQLDAEEREKQQAYNTPIVGAVSYAVNQCTPEIPVKGRALKRSATVVKKGPPPEKRVRQTAPVIKGGSSTGGKKDRQPTPMLKKVSPMKNRPPQKRQTDPDSCHCLTTAGSRQSPVHPTFILDSRSGRGLLISENSTLRSALVPSQLLHPTSQALPDVKTYLILCTKTAKFQISEGTIPKSEQAQKIAVERGISTEQMNNRAKSDASDSDTYKVHTSSYQSGASEASRAKQPLFEEKDPSLISSARSTFKQLLKGLTQCVRAQPQ